MNVVVIWRTDLDSCSCFEFDVWGLTFRLVEGCLSTLFEDRWAWGLIRPQSHLRHTTCTQNLTKFDLTQCEGGKLLSAGSCGWEKNTKRRRHLFNEISINHWHHFTVIWQELTSWNPISQITLSNSSVSAEKQNALTMCELQCVMKMTVAAQCVFQEELLLLQTPSGAYVACCPRDLVLSEDISNFTIFVLMSAMLEDRWWKY